MGKKKKEEEKAEGAPGWMVTYGDMMSLLLTFFVLIVSFSSIQEAKFKNAMGSLQGALGFMPKQTAVQKNLSFYKNAMGSAQIDEMIDEVQGMKSEIAEMELQGQVKVTMTEKGAHIVISDPLLFDLGKAELKSDIYPLLDMVAKLIKNSPNTEVIVEGHTDNWPIRSEKYPSNWELSSARALAVVKYFAFQCSVNPARLAGVGYGEYRPIKPNDSAANRATNRRVEIFVNTKQQDISLWAPELQP